MAGKYKVKFGVQNDEKLEENLKQDDVMVFYDKLVADGEHNIRIVSPNGEILDPHQFRLNCKSGWGAR